MEQTQSTCLYYFVQGSAGHNEPDIFLGGFVLNTVYKVPEYSETIGQATKCTTSVKNVTDMILQKILTHSVRDRKQANRNEMVK